MTRRQGDDLPRGHSALNLVETVDHRIEVKIPVERILSLQSAIGEAEEERKVSAKQSRQDAVIRDHGHASRERIWERPTASYVVAPRDRHHRRSLAHRALRCDWPDARTIQR